MSAHATIFLASSFMEDNQAMTQPTNPLPWRVPPREGMQIRVWGSAPHAAVIHVQDGRLHVAFTGDPLRDWVIAERVVALKTPAPRAALATLCVVGGVPPAGWDGAERYGAWAAHAAEQAIAYLRQAHVPPTLLEWALTRRTLRAAHDAWEQIARWSGRLRPRQALAQCASRHAYPLLVAGMLGWRPDTPPPPHCDIRRVGVALWDSARMVRNASS